MALIDKKLSPLGQNSNLDVLKFIMALVIVWLHSGFYPPCLSPLLRIPVPVFFIISAYLFFRKLYTVEAEGAASGRRRLAKFVKRSLILYAFWFVVTFPVTYVNRHYGGMGLGDMISNIIYGIFLQSTFVASWYITALVISVIIVYALRRHLLVALAIGGAMYVVCCIETNYYYAFPAFVGRYSSVFGSYDIFTSFPAGIFWVAVGAVIAKCGTCRLNVLPWLLLSLLILAAEYVVTRYFNFSKADDCYLSLMLVAPLLFLYVNSMVVRELPFALGLRKAATIFYCSHGSLLMIVQKANKLIFAPESVMTLRGLCLLAALVACTVVSLIIIRLASQPKFKWLKYSY